MAILSRCGVRRIVVGFVSASQEFLHEDFSHGTTPPSTTMTLKAYLALLATDISQLNAFISDPSGAAKSVGLSAEDCAKLSCGDSNIHDEQLVAIGTGIRSVGQFSTEAIAWLKKADKV